MTEHDAHYERYVYQCRQCLAWDFKPYSWCGKCGRFSVGRFLCRRFNQDAIKERDARLQR